MFDFRFLNELQRIKSEMNESYKIHFEEKMQLKINEIQKEKLRLESEIYEKDQLIVLLKEDRKSYEQKLQEKWKEVEF